MQNVKKKSLSLILAAALTSQLVGCGTVFYPERKGQQSGSIDPVVAIANGVGLLFFILPGVLAFAIDFSNGAIYLPDGKQAKLEGELTPDGINEQLYASTGQRLDWQHKKLHISQLNSVEMAQWQLAQFQK
ncbi:hypothetical protein [Oceanisphaera avium]|uniref:Uncharacterized protein n=1 Tax=Oceanisphaera avium TaxID=1903694 RepID=A0A1Y0CVN9_9GAMM|nr:hypothetical protein [Oceanisphaera avium]ART78996.1 hypothetical protein CBP12_01565 [Oceanisphaera avium]